MAVEIRAATYAALRTALAAGTYQAGQMVFCEGRSDIGDGGQGPGQVVAIGSLTDDGAVTLTGGSLAWVRNYTGPAHAVWFEAATDTSTYVQGALDSGLPHILFTEPITVDHDIVVSTDDQIIEFGPGASWRANDGVSSTWIQIDADRVKFRDVNLDGTLLADDYDISRVVIINDGHEEFSWVGGALHGFEATANYLYGVYFLINSNSNVVGHLFDGINFHDLSSTDNLVVGDTDGAVRAIVGSCSGSPSGVPKVTIRHCRFENIPSAEDSDAIAFTGTAFTPTTRIEIYDNQFFDIGKRAVKAQVAGVHVFRNRIFNLSVNDAGDVQSEAILIGGDNSHAYENHIEGFWAAGVQVGGNDCSVNRNRIDLRFDFNSTNHGVRAVGVDGLEVRGNTIFCKEHGVYLTDCVNVAEGGNRMVAQYGTRLVYTEGENKTINMVLSGSEISAATRNSVTVSPVSMCLATNTDASGITLTNLQIVGNTMFSRSGSFFETDDDVSIANAVLTDNRDWGTTAAFSYRIEGNVDRMICQITRLGAHTGEVLRVSGDATDVIIAGCFLPASFTTNNSLQDVFGTSTRVTSDISEQYTYG